MRFHILRNQSHYQRSNMWKRCKKSFSITLRNHQLNRFDIISKSLVCLNNWPWMPRPPSQSLIIPATHTNNPSLPLTDSMLINSQTKKQCRHHVENSEKFGSSRPRVYSTVFGYCWTQTWGLVWGVWSEAQCFEGDLKELRPQPRTTSDSCL